MFSILVNTDLLDNILTTMNMTAEEYCKSINFDYNQFMRVYNNDLSLTLREIIKFSIEFNIFMEDLLMI